MMKKLIKITICILLILSLSVPTGISAKTNAYIGVPKDNTNEIKDAISLGIAPNGFTTNYKKLVTEKQVCMLLLNCIEKYNGKKNTTWRKKVAVAKNKTITRQILAELVYKGANAMGMNLKETEKNFTVYYPMDKLNKKFVKKWIAKNGYNGDLKSSINSSYVEIAESQGEEFKNFTQLTSDSVTFVTMFGDAVTSRKVMELTSDCHFRPQAKATCLEAILAAYRLYKGMEPKPNYVTLDKVSENTINKSLLKKTSSLPDASNQKLPAWRGVNITDKASASDGALYANLDRNFHEDKIKFLSEHGFNEIRVQFGFSTLGYPDYPSGKVNLNELEELDQFIGWCMKYDIHVDLNMNGRPERANQWENETMTGNFFTNKKLQKTTLNYWKMLAKRYADIPNKYLSFNLMGEPEPDSDEIYTEVFKPIVEAIWAECPGRVIIADTDDNNGTGEGLAKLGVALSYHFYEPNLLCYYGLSFFTKEFPTLKEPTTWPLLYLPAVLNGENQNALTVEGNFSKGTVSIYVHDVNSTSKNILSILADGKVILKKEIKGKDEDNAYGIASVQQKYTATIPDGTKKIDFKINDEGCLRLTSISILQGSKTTTAYAHDLYHEDYNAKEPTLLYSNGRFSDKEKDLAVNWDYFYNKTILPKVELANKYHVGFMIGEFAPFGKLLPKSVLLPYMDMLLSGFKKEGIGWNNGGFLGEMYVANYYPVKGEYHFKKESGMSFYYNEELLNTYKKYLK